MKRNQNTPQLLREHHLRRERDTALRQRAEASSNAIESRRAADQARREAAEARQQKSLVKATKWYCNESNSDTITMPIRVPRDRWVRPQEAEMVLAHGLEQLGCAMAQRSV